jgi:hypothetical protein
MPLLELPRPRVAPPRCASCGREVLNGQLAGGLWFCSREHLDRYRELHRASTERLRRLEGKDV